MRASARLLPVGCWWLVISGGLLATGARAEQITTTPLQFYGLGTLTCAAWSPDGSRIITGGNVGAFLWDADTSGVIRVFIGHTGDVVAVAISPDGTKILTGSADKTARLWNAADGTTIRTFTGYTGLANSVAFSPDGTKLLIAKSDRTARLYNVADGTQAAMFLGHLSDVLCVAYSPDGTKVLTGSKDNTAKLWNATTGAPIESFNCEGEVPYLAYSRNGSRILTASRKDDWGWIWAVTMWNTDNGLLVWTYSYGSVALGAVAFTADDQRALVGDTEGWLYFFDTATGNPDDQLYGGSALLASVGFSPDGEYLLTATAAPENAVRIWNTSRLPYEIAFLGHTGSVSSVAFSPDGTKVLTGSDDSSAKLWNASDGAFIRTFSGHTAGISSVAFSPDGTKVLTGSADRTAKLCNALDGALIRTFVGHSAKINSVAFSPDGTKVLTGAGDMWTDPTAWLWNVSDGTVIRTFVGHSEQVNSVAFSPDGTKVLTGSGYGMGDCTAALWNTSDGSIVRTFTHSDQINSVAFSPHDGAKILTGIGELLWGKTAILWNALDGRLLWTFGSDRGDVLSVTFSPDGTKVLIGESYYTNVARLLNASDGTLIRSFAGYWGHRDSVNSVAFSPDGKKILTGSYDKAARLWYIEPAASRLPGHVQGITAVAVSGNASHIVTAHEGNTVNLWSATGAKWISAFSGHMGRINSVVLSPGGEVFLTGSDDDTAKLWDAANGQLIRTFIGHTGDINSVAFSSDATRMITASDDGMAVLWRAGNGAALQNFVGHNGAVCAAAISPSGLSVLTGGADSTARLWNATTGEQIRSLSHGSAVRSATFSADGLKILTGGDNRQAKFWNANDGTLIRTFSGHSGAVLAVAFSPDGNQIMTTGDSTSRLWKVADGTVLRTFGHPQSVTGAALFSDGTRVVTGSADGMSRLWSAFATSGTPGPVLPPTSGDRIVLVAGGGNFIGNPIVGQTQALADRAFFTCLVRGYKRDEIRYLSAFNDWATRDSNHDGLPDADAQATTQTFWSAIDTWSSGTARLFIYLIDHGSYNATTGQWYFRLNQTQYIAARDLDSHLDTLQTATGCEVILIVDCCYAGGFVQQCKAPAGARRVVVASTTPSDLSIYTPPAGAESFSFYFLSFAILGNTIRDCYDWTALAFQAMGNPAGQDPWMDDNGDGVSNKWDGSLASRHVLGRYPAFGLNAPTILSVATTQTIWLGQSAVLWAKLDEAVAAKKVWAIVVPQNATYGSGQPVTNLTRVSLAFSPTLNRWQATWQPGSKHAGQNTVTYFALSEDSLGTRLVATPKTSGLIVRGGTSVRIPWRLFE